MKKNLPLIAIIGRVNVGKSTLFNKLIEQQKALISKIPGTTRDLNFGVCEWQGKKFEVVDTGGIFEQKIKDKKCRNDASHRSTWKKQSVLQSTHNVTLQRSYGDSIEIQVELKAREILNKADLILFLVDAKDGILKNDRLIANLLKKSKKPYILVANKIDKTKSVLPEEFKKLGLGEVIEIAATSGVGVGDLLDIVIDKLKGCRCRNDAVHRSTYKNHSTKPSTQDKKIQNSTQNENEAVPRSYSEKPIIRVSIVGKPNVGKSSLLNQILGEDKVIVSPVPHTTREPQNTTITYQNHQIELVDTAGIRRKSKVAPKSLEAAGIQMSIKALKKSDVALFVLDISESLSSQDAQLAGLIIESNVSAILVANKYDSLAQNVRLGFKTQPNIKELTNYTHRFFPFLTWAPIIFTSGLTGRNCQKILKLALDLYQKRTQQINKVELNDFIKYLMKKMPPPRQPRKFGSTTKSRAYISKIIQVKGVNRPIFEIHVTNITKIPENYLRYLENNIRDRFKFEGTPITLRVIRNG